MIISADASQLEWRCIAHLANDKTAIEEIENGVKFHKENQKRFGLPAGELGYLTAKVFLFRAIYKGSAYAYSVDPDFAHIGNEKFWQKTIDKFYEKYSGIQEYHNRIIKSVVDTGTLVVPTGRTYTFEPRLVRGEFKYSETDICNYPVQGIAADIMALIRVEIRKRLKNKDLRCSQYTGYLPINTVHDSVVLDTGDKAWYNICIEIDNCFKKAQQLYQEVFLHPLLVPMNCEIKVGTNWKWMHHIRV